MDSKVILNNIPTTRYQGSKRKILPWIYECIKDIEFNTVLDAFGGSGMVSCLLESQLLKWLLAFLTLSLFRYFSEKRPLTEL